MPDSLFAIREGRELWTLEYGPLYALGRERVTSVVRAIYLNCAGIGST